MPPLKAELQMLYETDYMQWIETTIEKLRSQDYANVDWENLIEEIEDCTLWVMQRLERGVLCYQLQRSVR